MNGWTSVSVDTDARNALRRLTASMTGRLGQRVNMGDAIRLAERALAAPEVDLIRHAIDLGIIEDPTPAKKTKKDGKAK